MPYAERTSVTISKSKTDIEKLVNKYRGVDIELFVNTGQLPQILR